MIIDWFLDIVWSNSEEPFCSAVTAVLHHIWEQIAEALGVPTSGSADEVRQLIKGKLQETRDVSNVQVAADLEATIFEVKFVSMDDAGSVCGDSYCQADKWKRSEELPKPSILLLLAMWVVVIYKLGSCKVAGEQELHGINVQVIPGTLDTDTLLIKCSTVMPHDNNRWTCTVGSVVSWDICMLPAHQEFIFHK